MAKIRVFELARDLNMTNKVLLERMRDLDISVVSHLSSLEDEDVAKIKENVVGGKHKKAEVIPAKTDHYSTTQGYCCQRSCSR